MSCGGHSNKMKLWDITANPPTNTYNAPEPHMVVCAYSSPTRMGTATDNHKLFYNAIAGGITSIMNINADSCKQIAFSPNGNYMIASCSATGGTSAYFIQVVAPTSISSIVTVGNLWTAAYAGDGQTCSYGGDTNILYVVNATSANKTILS